MMKYNNLECKMESRISNERIFLIFKIYKYSFVFFCILFLFLGLFLIHKEYLPLESCAGLFVNSFLCITAYIMLFRMDSGLNLLIFENKFIETKIYFRELGVVHQSIIGTNLIVPIISLGMQIQDILFFILSYNVLSFSSLILLKYLKKQLIFNGLLSE